MFKLQPNPTFIAKVDLSIPGEEKPQTIDVEFRHMSRKEIKAHSERNASKTDVEALGEIIVGWKGVDAEFSAETLGQLLDNYPLAAGELFAAFSRELFEARRKN